MLRVFAQEDVNFLLTNCVPRRLLTQFIGWFSRIEQPLIRDFSIAVWQFFSGPRFREAKQTQFRSMHHCFIRELKEGARPIDLAAGHFGQSVRCDRRCLRDNFRHCVVSGQGLSLHARRPLGDRDLVEAHRNGRYVTLRLTSSMYHRFHAPHDGRINKAIYISGDTWNVNPIALKRIERLFCKTNAP